MDDVPVKPNRFRSIKGGTALQRESDKRLHAWEVNYKRKTTRGRGCVHWVLWQRCTLDQCWPLGHDHLSAWQRKADGARVLVSQPYADHVPKEHELIDYLTCTGLDVLTDAGLSWHYPGKTVLMAFTLACE